MSDHPRRPDPDRLTAAALRERGSLKWTKYGSDVIGAFVAEMDVDVAEPVRAALRTAVERQSFGYLPPGPATALAEACASFQHRRYGWRLAADQVYPVSDVLTGFELVLRHFTTPGSPIVLPTPAYMPFLTLPPLHGRAVLEVPMVDDQGRYTLDMAGLDAAFRAGGELLVLCNPANPVGRVLTAAELAAVTDVVDRHGARVFADEVHAPLTYPPHRHLPYAATSETAAGHTVTATSASKGWNLPGLKCAQVILSNPADHERWRRVGTSAASAPGVLGVAAAVAAYQEGEPWLDAVVGHLDRNRRRLAELLRAGLPQLRYTPPEGTYLAWLDCRALPVGPAPADFLLRRARVAVVDGAECGAAGRGHIRLNIATPLPILTEMADRLVRAVATEPVP